MDFFLVNKDNEAANSLMLKLSGEKRKGELIPCTKEEMKAFNNGDFVHINHSNANVAPVNLIEVDENKTYVAIVNERTTSIEDLVYLKDSLIPNLRIVRTRG